MAGWELAIFPFRSGYDCPSMAHIDETVLNSLLASGVDLPTALAAATVSDPLTHEGQQSDESLDRDAEDPGSPDQRPQGWRERNLIFGVIAGALIFYFLLRVFG